MNRILKLSSIFRLCPYCKGNGVYIIEYKDGKTGTHKCLKCRGYGVVAYLNKEKATYIKQELFKEKNGVNI